MPSAPGFDLDISLAVDDKTRHWLYFGMRRSDEEKARSLHKSDMGGAIVTRTAHMHDGRGNPELTLDQASFELVECPTQLSTEDFYELDSHPEKLEKYKLEVEQVVKSKLKCDKVVFLHHQVRNAAKQTGMISTKVAGYASGGPHTDSSSISGDALALNMLEGSGDGKKYKRYLYLNLWRNISEHPIENDHLACMDERTAVKPDDYVIKDTFFPGGDVVQYALSARHAASHKWYYFPQMKKDEGILFKQIDSDWTKPGRTCFHMSAHDSSVDAGRPSRESIELRMFCYWEDAEVDSMPTRENMSVGKIKNPREVADNMMQTQDLLDSATVTELVFALLRRLPVVGRLFGGKVRSSVPPGGTAYSGRPSDYVSRFVVLADQVPAFPQTAKDWIKSTILAHGEEKGIAEITKVLVDDVMDYHGTKGFAAAEKAAIAEALLADETYMNAAEKQFLKVAAGSEAKKMQ